MDLRKEIEIVKKKYRRDVYITYLVIGMITLLVFVVLKGM